jgi:hypothetical protein
VAVALVPEDPPAPDPKPRAGVRSRTETTREMLEHLADELGIEKRRGGGIGLEEQVRKRLPIARDTDWIERPKTRGECVGVPRPCRFSSCPHHMRQEVDKATGHILIRHPDLEIEAMPVTCSLDYADDGGHTLEEVATAFGLTRERIRQIEEVAIRKIKRAGDVALELPPEPRSPAGTGWRQGRHGAA